VEQSLRFEVQVDGRSPQESWNRFLDSLFDFFDSNADGVLAPIEVQRIFPLPLTKSKKLTLDIAILDTDRNGTASRQEFRAGCLEQGFGPIIVTLDPASIDDLRLGAWWQRSDWQQTPAFLRRFDLNDDEFLDLTEITAATDQRDVGREPHDANLSADASTPAVLHMNLEANTLSAKLQARKQFRLMQPGSTGGLYRLHVANSCAIVFKTTRGEPDLRSTREFLLSQLETALGTRDALSKADIEEDVALSGLAEVLVFADRNNDGRLGLGELTKYLDLIDNGVRAQHWIKITDRARNPFSYLDADGDGRLNLRELRDLKGLGNLPRQFQMTLSAPTGVVWGAVHIPARAAPSSARPLAKMASPRWFKAMDSNNDGLLSPREFLGPPVQFQKLDRDSDGLISDAEAQQADSISSPPNIR